jgi:maltooligosyltrehalose trehalohydrolase
LLSPPADAATFERCKLDFAERERNAGTYALHRDLLRLRRETPAFSQQRSDRLYGAVLSSRALVVRFLCPEADALLFLNLGDDLDLRPMPEPLLAPPEARDFRLLWSSEHPRYGGAGVGTPHADGRWRLPAQSALVFIATSREERA